MSTNTAVMVVLIVGVGVAAYLIYTQNLQTAQPPTQGPSQTPAPSTSQTTVPQHPTQVTTGVLASGTPTIYQNVVRTSTVHSPLISGTRKIV